MPDLAVNLLVKLPLMSMPTLNPEETAQLTQTIDMFEVIVQAQPADTQSLEILKEAYRKLGRRAGKASAAKRREKQLSIQPTLPVVLTKEAPR